MTMERIPEMLPDFIEWYDEPFYDYSGMCVFLLSQMARERV